MFGAALLYAVSDVVSNMVIYFFVADSDLQHRAWKLIMALGLRPKYESQYSAIHVVCGGGVIMYNAS